MDKPVKTTLLFRIVLLLSIAHFAAASWQSAQYGFVDLPIFVERTGDFAEGRPLYPNSDLPDAFGPASATYKFPPLFAATLLPQVKAGLGQKIYPLHWGAHLVIYLAALMLLRSVVLQRAGVAASRWLLLIGLNFVPFFETLWRLQLETPILFLVSLALWLDLRRRSFLGGVALGIAAVLKVYPLFLFGWYVLRRHVPGIAGAAVGLALGVGVGWWVIGAEQNLVYFTEVLPALLREVPIMTPENIAIAKPLHLWLGLDAGLAKRAAQAIALGVVVVGFFALHGRQLAVRRKYDSFATLSLLMGAMLLFMPNPWTNYLELLIVPIAFIVATLPQLKQQEGWSRDLPAAMLMVAFVLSLFFTPCAPAEVGWPCSQTPRFFAVVRLPRVLHDLAVSWQPLVAPLICAATLMLLPLSRRRQDATADENG